MNLIIEKKNKSPYTEFSYFSLKMRSPRFVLKFWQSECKSKLKIENDCGTEKVSKNMVTFWGSTEEHEVQSLIQQIVTSSLDSAQCTGILENIRNRLESSSSGWADRFVISQGIVVLHKLLADINTEGREFEGNVDRELVLVQCFFILYEKSNLAQQLITQDPKEQIMKTLLRSLLSPCEETRVLVSQTVVVLKYTPGSPSRVLHTLNLRRNISTD